MTEVISDRKMFARKRKFTNLYGLQTVTLTKRQVMEMEVAELKVL